MSTPKLDPNPRVSDGATFFDASDPSASFSFPVGGNIEPPSPEEAKALADNLRLALLESQVNKPADTAKKGAK